MFFRNIHSQLLYLGEDEVCAKEKQKPDGVSETTAVYHFRSQHPRYIDDSTFLCTLDLSEPYMPRLKDQDEISMISPGPLCFALLETSYLYIIIIPVSMLNYHHHRYVWNTENLHLFSSNLKPQFLVEILSTYR